MAFFLLFFVAVVRLESATNQGFFVNFVFVFCMYHHVFFFFFLCDGVPFLLLLLSGLRHVKSIPGIDFRAADYSISPPETHPVITPPSSRHGSDMLSFFYFSRVCVCFIRSACFAFQVSHACQRAAHSRRHGNRFARPFGAAETSPVCHGTRSGCDGGVCECEHCDFVEIYD